MHKFLKIKEKIMVGITRQLVSFYRLSGVKGGNIDDSLFIENELIGQIGNDMVIPVYVCDAMPMSFYDIDRIKKHAILIELPSESNRGFNRVFVWEDQLFDPATANDVTLIEEEVT